MNTDVISQTTASQYLTDTISCNTLWDAFRSHDLRIVTKRFKDDFPEYANIAEELEIECKRFLYAATIVPDVLLVPSTAVDEYWHEFILFTKEYQDFCINVAGRFIHHEPIADDSNDEQFAMTKQILLNLFGSFPSIDLWDGDEAARSKGKGCCGTIRNPERM